MPGLDPIMLATLIGGILLLAISGDFLVRGAVALSRALGVPALVIGIFVVGLATSAPEIWVALRGALQGYPDMALGNIVGSNIANIWFVLAVPALIFPMRTGNKGQRSAVLWMVLITAGWITLTAFQPLTPVIGGAMLGVLLIYAIWMLATVRRSPHRNEQNFPKGMGAPLAMTLVILGGVGLPIGAHLAIEGGATLAKAGGISDEYIGLTILAVGTSLPELTAGIAAAVRRRSDILVGNIIGSNVFNVLGAGGLISFFGGENGIKVTGTFVQYDHWAMGLAALTAALFILPRQKISRLAAVVLLLLYAIYLYGLIDGWNFLAYVQGTGSIAS